MLNAASASQAADLPIWTINWLKGTVNSQQGHLTDAIENYRSVLTDRSPLMIERGYDFSKDYRVINDLAKTIFEQSKRLRGESQKEERLRLREEARDYYRKTLELDSEDVAAHFGLSLIYEARRKRTGRAARALHERYKPDDNAGDQVSPSRAKDISRQRRCRSGSHLSTSPQRRAGATAICGGDNFQFKHRHFAHRQRPMTPKPYEQD